VHPYGQQHTIFLAITKKNMPKKLGQWGDSKDWLGPDSPIDSNPRGVAAFQYGTGTVAVAVWVAVWGTEWRRYWLDQLDTPEIG
jgi:hypothetical protein